MNFTNAFEVRLDDYIREGFGDASNLLVYLHIPKTAGNSSLGHLKRFKKNYFDIEWDNVDRSWEMFTDAQNKNPYELVSGHFLDRHVQTLSEMHVAHNSVSFLRHPVDRIVSQYRYMCTSVHPGNEAFIKEFPSFESFAFGYFNPNYMAECLVGGADTFDEYLEKSKLKYKFLGLTEFYNASMIILCMILGIPYKASSPVNVTISNETNSFQVEREIYRSLCDIHSLDLEFYEFLYRNYCRTSDNLLAYLVRANDW